MGESDFQTDRMTGGTDMTRALNAVVLTETTVQCAFTAPTSTAPATKTLV